MLNALKLGAIMLIYRCMNLSETMVVIRGKHIEFFYDDGNITDEILMTPQTEYSIIQ